MTNTTNQPEPGRRSTLVRLLPAAWLALSAAWAAVVVVTEQVVGR